MANVMKLEIDLSDADALNKIKKFESQVKKSMKDAGENTDNVGKSFSDMTGNITGAIAQVAAIAVSFKVLYDQMSAAVKAAHEYNQTMDKLNAALSVNNQAIAKNSEAFVRQQDSMSRSLGIMRNDIAMAQAQLINMGISAEDAMNIINVAADLAAGSTMEFNDAAIELGKTLNTGSVGPLADFVKGAQDLTEKQIRAGEAVKLTAEAYKGMAVQTVDPVNQLSTAYDNLKITLGNIVDKGEGANQVLGFMKTLIEGIDDALKNGLPKFQKWAQYVAQIATIGKEAADLRAAQEADQIGGLEQSLKLQQESLTHWKEQYAIERKIADANEIGSDARDEANKKMAEYARYIKSNQEQVDIYTAKLKQLKGAIEEVTTAQDKPTGDQPKPMEDVSFSGFGLLQGIEESENFLFHFNKMVDEMIVRKRDLKFLFAPSDEQWAEEQSRINSMVDWVNTTLYGDQETQRLFREEQMAMDLETLGMFLEQKLITEQQYEMMKQVMKDQYRDYEIKQETTKNQQELQAKAGLYQAIGNMLGTLGSAMEVHNKADFKRQQAVRAAACIMNTAAGVMMAYAQGGIYATPIAIMIGITGAIQLAKIMSEKYKPTPQPAMPSFAVGASLINKDMTAQVHKGEAIVPAAVRAQVWGEDDTQRLSGNTTFDFSGAWIDSEERVAQIAERIESAKDRSHFSSVMG